VNRAAPAAGWGWAHRSRRAGRPGDSGPFAGGSQVPEAFAENRTILGEEQEAWLLDLLAGSSAPWNVLVQPSIVAEVDRPPDLYEAGYTLDAWDGYVASRNRVLGLVADEDVSGFVSVGATSHRRRGRPEGRLQGPVLTRRGRRVRRPVD
jgi:alkaline phosphatase D